jgi:hypothetical protein
VSNRDSRLNVEVWDDDTLGGDDIIGTGVVDLMMLAQHNNPQLTRIYLHKYGEDECGEPDAIILANDAGGAGGTVDDGRGVKQIADNDRRPYVTMLLRWSGTIPEVNTIVFEVYVVRGCGFLPTDENGLSDPYCELRMQGIKNMHVITLPTKQWEKSGEQHHHKWYHSGTTVLEKLQDKATGVHNHQPHVHNSTVLRHGPKARTSTKYNTLDPSWGEGFKFQMETTPEEVNTTARTTLYAHTILCAHTTACTHHCMPHHCMSHVLCILHTPLLSLASSSF